MSARFMQLSSGQVIDLENIALVVPQDLNTSYVIIPKASSAPTAPKLTVDEYNAFLAALEKAGLLIRVEKLAEKPVVATK